MADEPTNPPLFPPNDIKQVPPDAAVREAIRRAASAQAVAMERAAPPVREDLEARGRALLDGLDLPQGFLGFAMVALNNAFWRDHFAAVPPSRRLLLLPHCLRDQAACAGVYDSIGLHCAACGACDIHDLKGRAERLGYQVIVAEGTSSVLMKVLDGEADALLGVACLDSLEKSYRRVADLGIPHVAVPLLRNGCRDTEAETALILEFLTARGAAGPALARSYIPLLRRSVRLFDETSLAELLGPYVKMDDNAGAATSTDQTAAIALDWLRTGGKRFRPFITLAAYAVARHSLAALEPEADTDALLPAPARRLALAIEAMHKASLIHDDIEDDDPFRYGRATLHRTYGVPPAVNAGDYLVGLGYRLVAATAGEISAEAVADILAHLSAAHLDLCRGQGAELLWNRQPAATLRPLDALSVYALKTAPAFETALYAGLRAAGEAPDTGLLRPFCTYVGEGYQVLNDLEDWRSEEGNKRTAGRDALAGRPTLLRAFTLEAGGGTALAEMEAAARDGGYEAETVERIHALYESCGAFAKAERLVERLRDRALALAGTAEPEPMAELLRFLARVVLAPQG